MLNVSESSQVHPKAQLGRDVTVGPFSVIGEHVAIGDGTTIGSHVVIEGWTEIGPRNRIDHFAVLGTPPTCAIASMIKTAGMIGCPGKCPWKNGSFTVTFLMPMTRFSSSSSRMRSTRRNG